MQASLELTHLAASGLGVGIMYVANQNESKLARNQWDIRHGNRCDISWQFCSWQTDAESLLLCGFQQPSPGFQL